MTADRETSGASKKPASLIRPCASCPFTHDAAALRLTSAQTLRTLEHLFSGGAFDCHLTTEIDADGNLTADHALACPGAAMLVENLCQSHPELAALADRRGIAPDAGHTERLRGRERVFTTIDELFDAARPAAAHITAPTCDPLAAGRCSRSKTYRSRRPLRRRRSHNAKDSNGKLSNRCKDLHQ